MAKQSRNKITDQVLALYRVHRECVRRNSTYKEEYVEYQRKPEDPPLPKALAKRDLVNTWGVMPEDFPNPEERPSLRGILASPVATPSEVLRYVAWRNADSNVQKAMDGFFSTFVHREVNSRDVAGMMILLYFPEENLEHPSYTAFNVRSSKKELMQAFEEWLDSVLHDRRQAGLKQEVPQKRLRIKEYINYLQAYDLRESGMKFPEIERKIWRDSYELGRKAREYFVRGKSLVSNPPLLPQRRETNAQPSSDERLSKGE